MERKLASIQRIISLFPIPGADNIEGCQVLGWQCVVKKGTFKINDLCIYLEIDSLLPSDKPEFAFLAPRKFRIKTIRLKGQVAQGLAMPLSDITYADLSAYKEDDDVTEILGIKKYEPPEENIPACLRGKIKGQFPSFLKKTDEIRIQAVPGVLERHRGKKFYVSEKLDGSSSSAYIRSSSSTGLIEREFGICSRNLDIKREGEFGEDIKNSFWKTAININLEEKMRSLDKNIAFQGELVGPGVQKNKYKLPELDIWFFNVFDIDTHSFYNYVDFVNIITGLGLKTVPILEEIELNHTVDQLVEMSKGKSMIGETIREGIIFRPLVEDLDQKIGRLSFKVINPEFLLHYNI